MQIGANTRQVPTETLNSMKRLEEMPCTYDNWSIQVAHTLLLGEPRNFVGVNAPRAGSQDPVSTIRRPAIVNRDVEAGKEDIVPTNVELIDGVLQWNQVIGEDELRTVILAGERVGENDREWLLVCFECRSVRKSPQPQADNQYNNQDWNHTVDGKTT